MTGIYTSNTGCCTTSKYTPIKVSVMPPCTGNGVAWKHGRVVTITEVHVKSDKIDSINSDVKEVKLTAEVLQRISSDWIDLYKRFEHCLKL